MWKSVVGLVFVLCLCSCSPTDISTGPSSARAARDGDIQPMCILGCHDPDPAPDSAGYYFAGYRFTWEGCTNPDIDVDEDGLLDDCEYTLADAFAPLASFGDADDVRRETRWAARWDDGQSVYIAYLFGYWLDMGDTEGSHQMCFGLEPFPPFVLLGVEGCNGHLGDSEYIVLRVQYNGDTHHWYLTSAWYSEHGAGDAFFMPYQWTGGPIDNDAIELTFPEKYLGYPKVWVANGKHANYATRAQCNAGGTLWADDCSGDRIEERVFVGLDANVGSSTHQLIDCVGTADSSHPAYSGHYLECYWTEKPFEGWFPATSNPSTVSYSFILLSFGF